jgi:hypothetical protein
MNKLLKLTIDVTQKRGLNLILTKNRARKNKTDLMAAIISQGPLFVVAGSGWLPSYELTHIIRKKTHEVKQCLNRLYTIRTPTCYRLLDSLANIPLKGEPLLVMDLLHTFYDSDIPLDIRFHKLRECCRHLESLAFYRPVLVLTQEMIVENIEDYEKFFPILHSVADRTLYLKPDEIQRITQPAFF